MNRDNVQSDNEVSPESLFSPFIIVVIILIIGGAPGTIIFIANKEN